MLTLSPDSDESEIASVEAAEPEDVDKAVEAARAAFKGEWRTMSSTERGDLMYKLAALVEEHKETLATIETWDNGTHDMAGLALALAWRGKT